MNTNSNKDLLQKKNKHDFQLILKHVAKKKKLEKNLYVLLEKNDNNDHLAKIRDYIGAIIHQKEKICRYGIVYKLAIQIHFNLETILSQFHGISQSYQFTFLLSVPELFVLYKSKVLRLGDTTWSNTNGENQLQENCGRHVLQVYTSPIHAYEHGLLTGWQLGEHYWTRHFRTNRECLIHLFLRLLNDSLNIEKKFGKIKAHDFHNKLDKFLHKKFPFELTDLLRKNQRLVSFHTLGDIQFHGGTHKATCSQLVINTISTIEQILREQSTL